MTEFISRYVCGLATYCKEYAKPKKFEAAMLEAIRSLILCDGNGTLTNEQRFVSHLQKALTVPQMVVRDCFDGFQRSGLADLKSLVKPIPLARKIVEECLAQGVPLVLATNPVFPEFMIKARLHWAELDDLQFAHLTSFENSCFCKPQAGYFLEIATLFNVSPQDCLMVGNDTSHDLSAAAVGMETYLVDTWLIDREESSWPCQNRGDHSALQFFLRECLQ